MNTNTIVKIEKSIIGLTFDRDGNKLTSEIITSTRKSVLE